MKTSWRTSSPTAPWRSLRALSDMSESPGKTSPGGHPRPVSPRLLRPVVARAKAAARPQHTVSARGKRVRARAPSGSTAKTSSSRRPPRPGIYSPGSTATMSPARSSSRLPGTRCGGSTGRSPSPCPVWCGKTAPSSWPSSSDRHAASRSAAMAPGRISARTAPSARSSRACPVAAHAGAAPTANERVESPA